VDPTSQARVNKTGRVAPEKAFGVKSWAGTLGSLAVVCVAAASRLAVRGKRDIVLATNQGSLKIRNLASFFWRRLTQVVMKEELYPWMDEEP